VEHARVATAADLLALQRLSTMARHEIVDQRGGASLVEALTGAAGLEADLRTVLGDRDRLVLLGMMDEVDVGFVSARCDRSQAQPVGVIDAIYVEPEAREVGVGEVLVDAVLAWSVDQGCRGVDASALPGSRPAKAFFEEHGFVTRLLVMHRPLSAPPPGGDGHG
jgi:GNAT superfamily N-acetyltransferase